MIRIKHCLRIAYIQLILLKNGLDRHFVASYVPFYLRGFFYLNPFTWTFIKRNNVTRGIALRRAMEQLGPIFIKFGQALSTRPDLLPEDIAVELSKLQDKVPPFSGKTAINVIESSLNKPLSECFKHFDIVPLASASMAQVHAAILHTGEEVVIKVLRPEINKILKKDIAIMYTMADLMSNYWPDSRNFKPLEIVREFEQNLLGEIDLQREAANATQLKRNFEGSDSLFIPKVYWDYTQDQILVMQRIYGIRVADREALLDYSIDLKKLAKLGIEIFFKQVFRDCFFHADLHPGNIFISTDTPSKLCYIYVDFGIAGTLSDHDKHYLAENLYAFLNRDYRRVAELHIESGWVPRNVREDEFANAIRTVCEPMLERPMKDISLGKLVIRLFQVAQNFHMEIQPQFVLLQKTLIAVEGLGRRLDPDLDIWNVARPFLESWLKDQVNPKAMLKQLKENFLFVTEQLPHTPKLIHQLLVLNKELAIKNLATNNISVSVEKKSIVRSWVKGFVSAGAILSIWLSIFGNITISKNFANDLGIVGVLSVVVILLLK